MKAIALIGANGQVGSEVSLLLSTMPGVSVVPIVRSRLGAAILERCGVACRVGAMTSDAEAKRLLEGCDLVADFSLPSGLPAQVRAAIRANARHAIVRAPRGAPYVFISSTMAFGSGSSGRYEDLWLARTPYAATKRYGERWARWFGRVHRRPIYVLRLGQVFGELQSVSRSLIASATVNRLALLDGEGGTSPSDAVFCSTIALALANIARGMEAPGTYTLLEAPEWTWEGLYTFHAEQAGIVPRFVRHTGTATGGSFIGARFQSLVALATAASMRQVTMRKDLLVAQLLPSVPEIERRMKARHLVRRACAEIQTPECREIVEVKCSRGPVPGRRLSSLSNSYQRMSSEVVAVRQMLHRRLGPDSHNYPLSCVSRGDVETPDERASSLGRDVWEARSLRSGTLDGFDIE